MANPKPGSPARFTQPGPVRLGANSTDDTKTYNTFSKPFKDIFNDAVTIVPAGWPQPGVIYDQVYQLRVIEAKRGMLNLRSKTLLLYGDVSLSTAGGYEIRTRRAVLAREHEGMYLPLGYSRHEERFTASSFLVLDGEGKPSHAVLSTRGLDYEDLIEKRERLVLRHYADRAPPALKPLLLAILSQLEWTAQLE